MLRRACASASARQMARDAISVHAPCAFFSSSEAKAPLPPLGQSGRFLTGKSALITGSTSGIGLAIARSLAAHGASVTLNGIPSKSGDVEEALLDEFKKVYGVRADFDGSNLLNRTEITSMIKKAQNVHGNIDILINNAGIQYISSTKDFPDDMWDKIIGINLTAVFQSTKAVLPQMLENKWGRIINISSVHGLVASVNKSAYVASKHGVVGFTKSAALECAGSGVTINCVNPGFVLTPLVQAQIELKAKNNNKSIKEAEYDLLYEKQPSKQFVPLEDVGNFVSYLSSDYTNQMTGACYVMDGGWTAQ